MSLLCARMCFAPSSAEHVLIMHLYCRHPHSIMLAVTLIRLLFATGVFAIFIDGRRILRAYCDRHLHTTHVLWVIVFVR